MVESESFSEGKAENVSNVDAVAVISEDGNIVSLFAVNRKLGEDAELELSGLGRLELESHISMEGDDLKAGNSMETPDNVTPVTHAVSDTVTLTGGSWNYLKFTK